MNAKKRMGDVLRQYAIILVLIALVLLFTTINPQFINIENILQIIRNISIYGIIAVGMTFCLISGGLDLSVGTISGLSVVVMAIFIIQLGLPVYVAVIAALISGTIIGAINATVIIEFNVPPFIATLATMEAFRGIVYVLTGAKPIFGYDLSFTTVGQGVFLGIPIPIYIFLIIFFIGWFMLTKTTYGRYVYGIGSGEEVSVLSGINVKKIKYIVYIINGLLSAFAGIILASRLNSGQPRAGDGYEFEVITACVLGGVSIAGGEGKLGGVLVGLLITGALNNGLIMAGVTEYYKMIITGAVLIIAVGFDATSRKLRAAKAEISLEDIEKERYAG